MLAPTPIPPDPAHSARSASRRVNPRRPGQRTASERLPSGAPAAHAAPEGAPAVLGVRVDVVSWDEALARIAAWVEACLATPDADPGAPVVATRQIVTLNPEIVMAARAAPDLRALIAAADLVVPDGAGVVWALRRAGWRGAERIPGVDLLAALAERAATRGWRLFLLGAAPGVADAAARRLCGAYPGLVIAGTHAGAPDAALDEAQTARIRASRADLVAIAYGAPTQERWIARNRERLGASVALGVGGALDVLAGRVPRAPRWLRRAGLEWTFRLARQPWRWRRMLALPRFVLAVLLNRS